MAIEKLVKYPILKFSFRWMAYDIQMVSQLKWTPPYITRVYVTMV